MIAALGLSPAWQQIVELGKLELGEVNRAKAVHWCASGKVLNVAVALQSLGAKYRAISPFGGAAGRAMREQLADLQVEIDWIATASPSRVCTTLLDPKQTTEIVENAGSLSTVELQLFQQQCRNLASNAEYTICTGSSPVGVSPSFWYDCVRDVSTHLILDLRGPELLSLLPLKPLLVKPNRQELAATVGRSLENDDACWNAIQSLHDQGAVWVLVTFGSKSTLLSGPTGRYLFHPATVETINPIGCGDSLTAGVAYRLQQGATMPEAVRFGIATAAQNAEQLLPARLTLHRVEELSKNVVCTSI